MQGSLPGGWWKNRRPLAGAGWRLGAVGESGWDGEGWWKWGAGGRTAHGTVQTGRSGGGRQQIPLPRREIRSSGN